MDQIHLEQQPFRVLPVVQFCKYLPFHPPAASWQALSAEKGFPPLRECYGEYVEATCSCAKRTSRTPWRTPLQSVIKYTPVY